MTNTGRVLLNGVLAGAVATLVKAKAEGALQPLAERLLPPTPEQKERPGADPTDGDNMPPTILVDRLAATLGMDLSDDDREQAAMALHWVMGIGSGVAYALVANRWPAARAGAGALGGLAIYAMSHASLVPAAGLQAPLRELPAAAFVWEPGSHVAYGVVLDSVLRALD